MKKLTDEEKVLKKIYMSRYSDTVTNAIIKHLNNKSKKRKKK